MATEIHEKVESRPARISATGEGTAELVYVITGTDNDVTAHALLDSTAPSAYRGMVLQETSLEPDGWEKWLGRARYGPVDVKDTGDSSFQFDTGGGRQKITQSLGTTSHAPVGQTAPDYKGAIGVTKDSVGGVDVTVPVYNFSETHYIAVASVTSAYKLTLFNLTGKVNNATFKGFAAGELLFLGASGSQRGQDDWEITFRFAASPNVTGLTIGSMTGVDKDGWEYLWVRYEDEEDTASKRTVKRPVAAYVEQVYESGDFSLLGI